MQQNCQITRCARQHTMDSVLKSAKLRRDLTGNRNGFTHARPTLCGRFHQSWVIFSVTNSRIAFQITIRFWHFRHNRNTKSYSDWWSYRPVNCICTKKYTVHRGSCRFSAGVEASVTWHTGFSQWRPLFVDSPRQIARSQNRSRMCEIHLTKLSCAAQQVGIVHFYAVTEIKGLSCRLWWMREWRNLLTSTHVGYRSVIRAVASGASLKFGVQGASATNWFSRVNGARDNGIRLYHVFFSNIPTTISPQKTMKTSLVRSRDYLDIFFFNSLRSSDAHLSAYWPSLLRIMAYCLLDTKLLSEPMLE